MGISAEQQIKYKRNPDWLPPRGKAREGFSALCWSGGKKKKSKNKESKKENETHRNWVKEKDRPLENNQTSRWRLEKGKNGNKLAARRAPKTPTGKNNQQRTSFEREKGGTTLKKEGSNASTQPQIRDRRQPEGRPDVFEAPTQIIKRRTEREPSADIWPLWKIDQPSRRLLPSPHYAKDEN